jgi:hypothetical protein
LSDVKETGKSSFGIFFPYAQDGNPFPPSPCLAGGKLSQLFRPLAFVCLSGKNGTFARQLPKGPIMFKLQVQEDDNDPQAWHDVKGPDGKLLIFDTESAARAKLELLFPILVKMERYAADTKRTRVISIYKDEQD